MRRPAFVLLAVCLFATPGTSTPNQPIIITVAGGGPDQVLVGDATIVPYGLILDGSGNLYVTSPPQERVFRVSPSGLVSVAAGSGVHGTCGDGIPALEACFTNPEASALDAAGNLFVADTYSQRVRRIDAVTGVVTTAAGNGIATSSIDGEGGDPTDDLGDGGPATSATMSYPGGLVIDPAGHLFIADSSGHRVRRVDAVSGVITTVAGTGTEGASEDGIPADGAALSLPRAVALDAHGNLLIADQGSSRIRIVDATTGLIGTVAGNGQPTGWIDGEGGNPSDDLGDGGPATEATLRYPHGVSVDGSGNILIADSANSSIRKVDALTGLIGTVAGVGAGTGYIDGPGGDPADDFTDGVPATTTTLMFPGSAVANAAGDVIIADTGNSRLRKVDGSTGLITSLSGDPRTAFGDGGPPTRAQLFGVLSVATDTAGNLFIADNDRVRRVLAGSGAITTVVGCVDPSNCHFEYGRPATETMLINVWAIAISPAGDLTISQITGFPVGRVVKVESATGLVRLVAGGGVGGDGGPATEARIVDPVGLEFDAAGNLFIAQSPFEPSFGEQVVRRIDAATGIITTVAGGGSLEPMDGILALEARLRNIGGITLDPSGVLFITERFTSRVWRVDAITGIITRMAGTGEAVSSGDGGPATEAGLCLPWGLDVDDGGGLLIAEQCGSRVRRVDLATGIIDTVAGNGQYGFSGDGGPAVDARLASPIAVAARPGGGFFVGDFAGDRVRLVAAIAPPVADAGPDQVVECSNAAGTPVVLDGSGSTGSTGDLGYLWTGPFAEGGGAATGIGPTVSLPIGASTISLVVAQGQLESATDTVDIRVTVRPEGLSSPLADLVPEGEDPPLPRKAFRQGSTLSLRLLLSCGSSALTDQDVPAPRLVALEREEGGVIPIGASFEDSGDGQWSLHLGTRELSAGIYKATIEMPDGRRFVARFQLR